MGELTIGELIALMREHAGLSLRQLERKTGISNALLSQIENGKIKRPSFGNIVLICRALNIKLDRLAEFIPKVK